MGELAKKVLERRRKQGTGSSEKASGGIIDIVDESAGSQNLTTGESLPFRIGDVVRFTMPEPDSRKICPKWVEHAGTVQAIDPCFQMTFIVTETGPGTEWVWVWWGYCRKANDGQAS